MKSGDADSGAEATGEGKAEAENGEVAAKETEARETVPEKTPGEIPPDVKVKLRRLERTELKYQRMFGIDCVCVGD